jgi:hypothetical protein
MNTDYNMADDLVSPSAPVTDWRGDSEWHVILTRVSGFVNALLLADMLKSNNCSLIGLFCTH